MKVRSDICFRKTCLWLRKNCLFFFVLTVILMTGLPAAGCRRQEMLGPVNDQAAVALIRYEQQADGISGVVYRQVNQLDELLAQSREPVVLVFYSPLSEANHQMMPYLEQKAVDYLLQIQFVWINAQDEERLSSTFSVDLLPQVTVMVDGAIKRSLIGFDAQWQNNMDELIGWYLD